jgi:tetratricopeptide (TPR) repeat protein
MSMTLNLVDSLLTTARNLHRLGRARAAEDALLRLLRLRVLPADATAEIHSLLAEIRTDQDDYRQVRRHLSEAIANRPNCAEYHFRMALAIEADPDVQPERARASYALALSLEPGNAVYWLEYAFHLLTIEDQKAGVAALRRAYALASDDPAIVGRVAAGLRQEGLVDEARSKLLSALFSHTRDRRFRALWQQHQFELLCAKQEEQRRHSVRCDVVVAARTKCGPGTSFATFPARRAYVSDSPSRSVSRRSVRNMWPGLCVTHSGGRACMTTACGVTPQAQNTGTSPGRSSTASPTSGRSSDWMPSAAGSPMCTGAP